MICRDSPTHGWVCGWVNGWGQVNLFYLPLYQELVGPTLVAGSPSIVTISEVGLLLELMHLSELVNQGHGFLWTPSSKTKM